MRLSIRFVAALPLLLSVLPAQQKQTPKKEPTEQEKEEIESGIPVTSEVVRRSCSPCHTSDSKQRMSRISWRRTTPEGWELTIKRMVSLNGVKLDPGDAREVLRYLSTNQGLAPEEALPASFEAEKRMIDYKYAASKDTEETCSKCHSMGRVISQRRSKSEWELLINMHRGYYPLSDFQAFRRMGPPQTQPGPDGRPPDNRHPMEKAIPQLAEALPLRTPEWSAWSANMRTPRLAGRWAFSGYQIGKGPFYGETTIRAGEKDGEFETETRYVRVKTGEVITRQGRSVVYTGFQWRGRSRAGSNDKDGLREVMFLARGERQLSGRWYTGAYDETGMDVTLTRLGSDPAVLGVDHHALPTGSSREIKIYGANFPANLDPSGVDFGRGVTIKRVIGTSPTEARVEVEVAKDASAGVRDVLVAGASATGAITVFDKIDAIKVTPTSGMARVGGANFPRGYQQFEAIAFSNGPDTKPDTKDDIDLGAVDVAWSVEEYTATYNDDDKQFVGTLDDSGLFTPNLDGPNPKRRNNADNVGDVWVVATYKTPDGRTLRARALLIVTVPIYMRFDQPEVAP